MKTTLRLIIAAFGLAAFNIPAQTLAALNLQLWAGLALWHQPAMQGGHEDFRSHQSGAEHAAARSTRFPLLRTNNQSAQLDYLVT